MSTHELHEIRAIADQTLAATSDQLLVSQRQAFVASGIIAVHIVDDNYFQPEWGGIADHVASGLVPLVAVATLLWLRLRLRGGARAVTTLLLGLVGLMVSSEALFHITTDSVAGDDWTGLLAAVGGAVLLGVGVRELWRSRRRDGSRWRRYVRRSLKTVAAVLVMALFAFPIIESYAVTNTADASVPAPRLGATHEDVSLRTSDGLRLTGWYVPSRNGAAVVVFPGRGGPQQHARMLIAHGYGVLLFDRRGTGDSDGEPNGWGWGSERDVHAAVRFLQQRPDVEPDRIGGLGLSVGGELLLQAAAENDGLRAVVSEGAGMRTVHEFLEIDSADRWLTAPLVLTSTISTAIFANQMPPPNLSDLVPRVHVPVFFIYAAEGQGGEILSEHYYHAANEPKQLWKTDSGHVDGISADPAQYEHRVVTFFDGALLR